MAKLKVEPIFFAVAKKSLEETKKLLSGFDNQRFFLRGSLRFGVARRGRAGAAGI